MGRAGARVGRGAVNGAPSPSPLQPPSKTITRGRCNDEAEGVEAWRLALSPPPQWGRRGARERVLLFADILNELPFFRAGKSF